MVLFPLGGCAPARPQPPEAAPAGAPSIPPAGQPLSESDRAFVLEAAGAGLYQLQAAQLAEQRAQDPRVRAFAAMLAQQYGLANDGLRALARSRGVAWPPSLPPPRQAVVDALMALAPEVFDRRYVEQLGIADHQLALQQFEAAGRTLQDPLLREWAQRRVPALQTLLAAAQQLPLTVQAAA